MPIDFGYGRPFVCAHCKKEVAHDQAWAKPVYRRGNTEYKYFYRECYELKPSMFIPGNGVLKY